jgi:hypothetical protein
MKLILAGLGCLVAGAVAASFGEWQPPHAAASTAKTLDVRVVATATYEATTDTPRATTTDGELPVARTPVGEQARSVLSFDVPASATAGQISLAVESRADQEYGSPLVSLCPLTATWQPGTGRQALSAAPAYTCSGVNPVAVTSTTAVFDLHPALAYWQLGHPSFGLALVMDADSTAPEKIVFNAIATQVVGTATVPVGTPSHPGATGGGASAPAAMPSTPTAAMPPPSLSTASGTTTAEMPGQPPVLAPAPATTPVAVAQPAALPVSGNAWLLLPGGVLLLVGVGRTLSGAGDPPLPEQTPVAT